MNKVEERLLNEWRSHGKLILAVDFDDTIYPYNFASQEECDKIIDYIKWVQSFDLLYTVIFTASNNDRHSYIKEYCKEKGLKVDSINCNPIDLEFGKEGKIYYNWFLCDRAGLEYSFEVFQRVSKIVITQINNNKSLVNV